jgi:hypothetical protein
VTDDLTEKVLADADRARTLLDSDPVFREATDDLDRICDRYALLIGRRRVDEVLVRMARKLADEAGIGDAEFAAINAASRMRADLDRLGGRK